MVSRAKGDEVFECVLASLGERDQVMSIDPAPIGAAAAFFVPVRALALITEVDFVLKAGGEGLAARLRGLRRRGSRELRG